MKICTKCGIEKPLSEFAKCSRNGFQYWCKECKKIHQLENKEKIRERHKKWYQENRDYVISRTKKWEKTHKKRVKKRKQEWAEENQEKIKKANREWYLKNKNKDKIKNYRENYRNTHKEQLKQQQRNWEKNNPEKVAVKYHRRRSRKLEAKGEFRVEDIQRMIELQGHKCLACGKKKPLTIDHIVPLSQGGRNDILNLQMLCQSCNSSKHTSTQDYRSRKLKKQIFEQQDLFNE